MNPLEFPQSKQDQVAALQQQLESAGIDTSEWGKGQAKTLAQLAQEIEDGETTLVVDDNGELLRVVEVGGAEVYYVSPDGKKYRLREERQVFQDGREKRRSLTNAVSEKIKLKEDPKKALMRGIQEELGIKGEINLTEVDTHEQLTESFSYPGLEAKITTHNFLVTLNDKQFNPAGYVESQSDKKTYFIWEEVKSGI